MKKQSLKGLRLSPASRAFVLVALLVIVILVLVWPPATWAFLTILAALPTCFTAFAAVLAIRNGSSNDKNSSDK